MNNWCVLIHTVVIIVKMVYIEIEKKNNKKRGNTVIFSELPPMLINGLQEQLKSYYSKNDAHLNWKKNTTGLQGN